MTELKFAPEAIETIPIADLKPYARNPRTHSKEQVAKIAASMVEFGWTVPIMINDDNEIIAGHGRIMAAEQLGVHSVPAIRLRHLSPQQVSALRIADNQITILGDWDIPLLSAETLNLGNLGFDLDVLGFDGSMLSRLLTTNEAGITDPDDAPEAVDTSVSITSDIWTLGQHRLLCGDATNKTHVANLLGAVRPTLMVTDPPYGVDYDPDWRNRADRKNGKPYGDRAIGLVTNDTNADWSEAYSLFPGDVGYVWHPAGARQVEFYSCLERAGFDVRMQIIWAKSHFPIGRGHYHVQHEPCWYAVRKGKSAQWVGDRKQTTLWKIDKPIKSETGHSTQKPVECMQRPITNNSSPGQAVYDPFVGSGTTIIAAQVTGRLCLAMEISPQYCDVAVRRWQNFTGENAILDGDGRTFDEIAEERTGGEHLTSESTASCSASESPSS